MEQAQPIVVRPNDAGAPPGPPTPGMGRRQLFEHEDRWVGGPDEPAEFFVIRVGTGPQNVNVDGPGAEPDGR